MAEYYPLLAKAVGRLPNSTPESRRVVYERARKALIGQLQTQHPPVPDEDIERESVELDRAVERLEAELANSGGPSLPPTAPPPNAAEAQPAFSHPPSPASPPDPPPLDANGGTGALGPAAKRPIPPLRTRAPIKSPFARKTEAARPAAPLVPAPSRPASATPPVETPPPAIPLAETQPASNPAPSPLAPPSPASVAKPSPVPPAEPLSPPPEETAKANGDVPAPPIVRVKSPRSDGSRPIAPQPRGSNEPKRRIWIIPVGIGVVVALVAVAAWKLRDRPETIARTKPAEKTQVDSGKIAERVGGSAAPTGEDAGTSAPAPETKPPASKQTARTQPQQTVPPAANPEIPVAHRAALLVEAPNEPNKVKTFLGTVVWKLNNVPQGANASVGLAVQADIELPDDKMKATVTFEKNADASLAASHTIKVQFAVEPGSYSGDVKQISTPQMRPEASPSGEALAGVTVPVVPNTFLVGLSPGNAEAANLDLMGRLQWIDVPMLLDNGKIAKLTFEKSDSGQRDLTEAFAAWQK